ncbi:MAG: sulfide/dihydroorotate dehydrogenase-like FAD/NAD-binding protein [Spirochaetales bacterium]|jgi:ferredoxin--NADP+ reductase|nr:sulfide/dihydroorotate dehydrogenase-like FAD/NAD-binding protein [Spirochaetales bacterium]
MVKIIRKKILNPTVILMDVEAPLIAAKAEPGQFVILRVDAQGERIPLTIADYDRQRGTVAIIFQIVGAATMKLGELNEGGSIEDFVGPLGNPTNCSAKKVAIIGGGVGSAIAYPVAKKFFQQGAVVHAITGFRTRDLIILEDEFKKVSTEFVLVTDDGSSGRKALVTDALKSFLDRGETYDEVIAIGPLIMMKFVAALTKPLGIKTVVSMNPIMIDGTGMCGGCRLSVGGKTKFACVDGPDFDGHEIDFAEAMTRNAMYRPFESAARDTLCKLLGKEAV